MEDISPETFEKYGICLHHVILFDYLSEEEGQFYTLRDALDELNEKAKRHLFDEELAEYIINNDSLDASKFKEAGGVFIDASCAYPDPEKVDFDADGEITGWACGPDSLEMAVYKPSLDEALAEVVENAKKIEATCLKVAREEFAGRVREYQSSEEN